MSSSLDGYLGSVQFPLDDSLVSTSLRTVADPFLGTLCQLLYTAIRSECQAAWSVATADTKFEDGYVCAMWIPFNPEPFLAKQSTITFPFLAIWRAKSKINYHSLELMQRTTDFNLSFAIGEATLEEMGKLYSVMNAVEAVIMETLDCGYHPDWNGGTEIFLSYRISIYPTESSVSHWGATSDSEIVIPVLNMTIQAVEVLDYNPTNVDLEALDLTLNVADDTGTAADVADGYSDSSPIIR